MSERELNRIEVLAQVDDGKLTVVSDDPTKSAGHSINRACAVSISGN